MAAAEVQFVTLTGTYLDFLGNPVTGWLDFAAQAPPEPDSASGLLLVPQGARAYLDAAGSFSISLPSTDSAVLPAGWLWRVTEAFPGGRTYTVALARSAGATQHIADLAPTPVVLAS